MTTNTLPHLTLFPAFGQQQLSLVAALQALPEYDEHNAAKRGIAEALSVASPDLLTAVQARQALVKQVAAAARADKRQPADLGKRAARAADAVTHAREAVTVLQEADRSLSEARAVGLGDVTTADEAIDAGRVDAWKRLTRLTGLPEITSTRGLDELHRCRPEAWVGSGKAVWCRHTMLGVSRDRSALARLSGGHVSAGDTPDEP